MSDTSSEKLKFKLREQSYIVHALIQTIQQLLDKAYDCGPLDAGEVKKIINDNLKDIPITNLFL